MSTVHGRFVENFHILAGLSPSSDIYNGNPASDVISLANYERVVFLIHQLRNATSTAGTATVKPQQVDNVSASNAVDLPFWWAKKTTGASSVWSALAYVAAGSTFTTTANEDTIYAVEVDASDLADGKKYVQLKLTESVNAPVLGSVIAIGVNPRYGFPFNLDPLA